MKISGQAGIYTSLPPKVWRFPEHDHQIFVFVFGFKFVLNLGWGVLV